MTYIKKLVMKGFKSFARETSIDFDRHTVVVVGPNGSGKSNITDALCFVLGRLSIKSIRATKAAHLIFSGNKNFKPANQAYVEIIFDNEKGEFAINEKDVSIKRFVNKNGQSIYKINGQTKTRQEVLELLSQAGIDPYGFNIVLQGEISMFVKMAAEERKKIIEEVSGISVYEMRKEKSLRELEKTEEKLKQINAVLRERANYLKNLEQEREQALKFKKLEETVRKCRASIINKNLQEKEKQLKEILNKIELKNKEIEKIASLINKTQSEIDNLNTKIDEISKIIQKSAGIEQDTLMQEINSLRQEIAGLAARKENFENQITELDRRKLSLENSIRATEQEIEVMSKEKIKYRKKELENKKAKLEEIEESRRNYYLLKSNLFSINNQINDKEKQLQNLKQESNIVLNQIEGIENQIEIKEGLDQHKNQISILEDSSEKNKEKIVEIENFLLEKEKISAVELNKINEAKKLKEKITRLDICPLCKTKITKEHVDEIINYTKTTIDSSSKIIDGNNKNIVEIKANVNKLNDEISKQQSEINLRKILIIKIQTIDDKKIQLKRIGEQFTTTNEEIKNLENNKKNLEKKISVSKSSEEDYEKLRLEINELERIEERDLSNEIVLKQRELERTKLAIRQNVRDKQDISELLKELNEDLIEKEELIEQKEDHAEIIKRKYQKMFEQKNSLQDKVRFFEHNLLKHQNEKRIFENDINNLNIEKAQISAKKDTLIEELQEFNNVELVNLPVEKLKEKIEGSEAILFRIGNVNLRALEIYDNIKAEYDKIKEKIDHLEREKENVLKIITQIDRKKRKTFLDTLKQINERFSRNFSQLSTKGIVTIELQDEKEIFNAGLDIIVKVGQGKYFDVTSLSGGEQSLVALSLIFAIQELNPYSFYIFDEIDAALDRRNSEKLAYLLKKHMKQGQYLIITHNDSIISESSNILYGVSMQEGVSKILSLPL
ncbi:MAG: chromosome segregation SMC family protein [Nanoarchaeota archaeon]